MKNEHDFEYEKSICYREGLEEGRAEGAAEKALSVARSLLAEGIAPETVASYGKKAGTDNLLNCAERHGTIGSVHRIHEKRHKNQAATKSNKCPKCPDTNTDQQKE